MSRHWMQLPRLTDSLRIAPQRQLCSRRWQSTMQNRDSKLDIRPIAGSLGAEIHGINLQNLDDTTAKDVRQAWLDHKVIFFRDQDLTPEQFLKFSAYFGKAVEYPFVKGIDGFPEIIQVLKREHETTNFGGVSGSQVHPVPSRVYKSLRSKRTRFVLTGYPRCVIGMARRYDVSSAATNHEGEAK